MRRQQTQIVHGGIEETLSLLSLSFWKQKSLEWTGDIQEITAVSVERFCPLKSHLHHWCMLNPAQGFLNVAAMPIVSNFKALPTLSVAVSLLEALV